MSSRGFDLSLSTVGVPSGVPPAKPVKSQKFFDVFDMKNELVEKKFECSWVQSSRLTVFGKLYLTRRVVAVVAKVFSASFRFVVPIAALAVSRAGAKALKLESAGTALVVNLEEADELLERCEAARQVLLQSKEVVPSIPAYDNRSWDFLSCGLRHVTLRQGEAAPRGELMWLARGRAVCRESGRVAPPRSTFGENAFFVPTFDQGNNGKKKSTK
jgi:hypothetical protein